MEPLTVGNKQGKPEVRTPSKTYLQASAAGQSAGGARDHVKEERSTEARQHGGLGAQACRQTQLGPAADQQAAADRWRLQKVRRGHRLEEAVRQVQDAEAPIQMSRLWPEELLPRIPPALPRLRRKAARVRKVHVGVRLVNALTGWRDSGGDRRPVGEFE